MVNTVNLWQGFHIWHKCWASNILYIMDIASVLLLEPANCFCLLLFYTLVITILLGCCLTRRHWSLCSCLLLVYLWRY